MCSFNSGTVILSRFLDCKILVQILLLPYILPPHGSTIYKKEKKKEFYKPSISESQKSIIVHAKVSLLLFFIIYFYFTNQNNCKNKIK